MYVDIVILIDTFNSELYKNKILPFFFKSFNKYITGFNKIFVVALEDYSNYIKLNNNYEIIKQSSEMLVKRSPNTLINYLYTIDNLSKNFVVISSNVILTKELNVTKFFRENYLEIKAVPSKLDIGISKQKIILDQYNIINKDDKSPFIVLPEAGILPMTKDTWNDFYKDNFGTPSTLSSYNYDYHAYYFWLYKNNKIIFNTHFSKSVAFKLATECAGIIKYDLLYNHDRELIILEPNDVNNFNIHETALRWVLEGLDYRINKVLK